MWEVGCLVPLMGRGHGPIAPGMGLCLPWRNSTSPAGSSAGGVRGVSAWGWERHPVTTLWKGRSPPGQGPPSCPLSLETGNVSIAPWPSPPPSRPHCISHRPGSVRFWQRRTGVPALSLPATSWPALPGVPCPACCHCRLPPQLSPLGVRDSAARAHQGLHFPAALAHTTATQPASPSMPESGLGVPPPLLTP